MLCGVARQHRDGERVEAETVHENYGPLCTLFLSPYFLSLSLLLSLLSLSLSLSPASTISSSLVLSPLTLLLLGLCLLVILVYHFCFLSNLHCHDAHCVWLCFWFCLFSEKRFVFLCFFCASGSFALLSFISSLSCCSFFLSKSPISLLFHFFLVGFYFYSFLLLCSIWPLFFSAGAVCPYARVTRHACEVSFCLIFSSSLLFLLPWRSFSLSVFVLSFFVSHSLFPPFSFFFFLSLFFSGGLFVSFPPRLLNTVRW